MPPDIGENFDPPLNTIASRRAEAAEALRGLNWSHRPELPPEPPVGTVLAYVVQLGQRTYHYASLRAGDGRWYTTGSSTQQGVNWAALVRALRAKQARVSVSTGWREWYL